MTRPVDLEVRAGAVLALLGPNGAGKTSLLTSLAGLIPRVGGEVEVDGERLPSGKPARARAAGVVLVPDDRALFPTLSVAENIEAARRRADPLAREMLAYFPELEKRWSVAAGTLSGGEQQMLAIARALVQQPRVLLIDEFSLGLAPIVVEALLPIVRHLADDGDAAVLFVEQHVHLALAVADRAVVLVHGDVVLRGDAGELASDSARLDAAYLTGSDDGGGALIPERCSSR